MEKYEVVKKKLCEEFDAIGRKLETGADMSDTDLNRLDRITHTLKSMCAFKENEEYAHEGGMSGRMGRSYRDGDGEFSGNSYADGYSRGYSDARSFNNGGSGMMYPPMYHGYGYGERNW